MASREATASDSPFVVHWYAVQAKPHREQLAAASLAQYDAQVFFPKMIREQLVCGVERRVIRPLFGGYLFARFSPELLLDAVRYAPGVLRLVGNASGPIPVHDSIIDAVRQRIRPDGFVKLETKTLQAGDQVAIDRGPLAGWMGEVEREWDEGKRISILLHALEGARVLVQARWLRRVETV